MTTAEFIFKIEREFQKQPLSAHEIARTHELRISQKWQNLAITPDDSSEMSF